MIPKVLWNSVVYTGQDAEEMGFEVAYGYLGCIVSVTSWWHQFHVQFAHVTDMILHVFCYFVVEDMFL